MQRCDHCLLEFPERDAVIEEIDGVRKCFCCSGCRGIYLLIHTEGLDTFYEKRQWKEFGITDSLLKREPDPGTFAEQVKDAEGTKEIDLFIEGIRCASCVWLNERILLRTAGITGARVNYATHRARIRWNPEVIGLDAILRRITAIGYLPKPYSESEQFAACRAETRDLLIRFGTAAFLSSQLMIYSIALYAGYFQGIDERTKSILEVIALFLTVPVIFYSGMPFIRNTLQGLQHLHFTMDSLITLGAGSAFVFSVYGMLSGGEVYFDTSAMIITLILLGRYIESSAKGRAAATIERLAGLAPRTATVLVNKADGAGEERQTVPVSSLNKGDLVEVKPGEKPAADGIVIRGESETDESLITGESKPVGKRKGDSVIGGSINLYGTIAFRVTRTGKETVLAGIMQAVEDAQARKPKVQAIADRVVGVFVPSVIMLAGLTVMTYLFRGATPESAVMAGIAVLVISCPCSLGLATPLAVLIFTSLASSKGILVKGGEVIENAGRLSHVLFDKTGTITSGIPVLKKTFPLDCAFDCEYIAEMAASIEALSEHSIGRAISAAAPRSYEVLEFKAFPGRGVSGMIGRNRIFMGNMPFMVENGLSAAPADAFGEVIGEYEAEGDTIVYMGWGGKIQAFFVIADVIRAEAREVVDDIREMNCAVTLISGDNERTTRSIAGKAGISNHVAGATPVQKREIIAAVQGKGGTAMMVGDGINDAPALTEAAVGTAMGRGTDIAMESADAVLVRNDLTLIPYFIRLSQKTFRIIRQNIFWAFFYNIIAVPLAMAGMLHPVIAAGAMAASSLFVVANSLRIRKGPFR